MQNDLNDEFQRPKKLSERAYEPIRNISNLSPYHERVSIEKRYLEKKEKLRSILIMGHLQKMQLNAINNRSIETLRKTKVAEEMSKKRYQSVDSRKSSKAELKIDNRKKKKQKLKTEGEQELVLNQSQRSEKIQEAYDKLIDDYMKHLSKDKLLEKGMDRKKIIQEACDIIKTQMTQKINDITKNGSVNMIGKEEERSILSQKRTLNTSEQNIHLPSIRQLPQLQNKKSAHKSDRLLQISSRRDAKSLDRSQRHQTSMLRIKPSPTNKSVIEIECNENLKQIENEQSYLSKQRLREEKLFLRKMKLIGMKNVRSLKSCLKEV